jgi:hypothetical protein
LTWQLQSDIEDVASYTPAAVVESPEWSSIVNAAEERRASFFKALSGKTLFSAIHGTYTVTLGDLKAMLKESNPAGQKTAPKTAGPPPPRRLVSRKSGGGSGKARARPTELPRKRFRQILPP